MEDCLEKSNGVLGAICGDIIGSCYEWHPVENKDFELFTDLSSFTDDTVMTLALAKYACYDVKYPNHSIARTYREVGSWFPNRGYGHRFHRWLINPAMPAVDSCGNGSAMRVSPAAYVSDQYHTVLEAARQSAVVSHNHPEGIKGAQAVAMAILMARTGCSKERIKSYIEQNFHYNLSRSLAEIRKTYKFEGSCQKSVPESIICWLEANTYEETVRNAVSLRGDADTMACIAGSIAAATPGMEIPEYIKEKCFSLLHQDLKDIYRKWYKAYIIDEQRSTTV